MGRNEKCGYEAETGRNTQNTEQIFIRVFLEGTAGRTQIPPRPTHPRDEILEGFLCGVHRNGTTAHSTGLPIFVLDAPLCVTKFRKDFCAECIDRAAADAQHVRALVTTTGVTGRQPTPFSPLIAPPRRQNSRPNFVWIAQFRNSQPTHELQAPALSSPALRRAGGY